jgi:SAM-dependent methyltransferase
LAILRKLYYTLTPGQRLLARRLAFLPVDLWEKLSGKRKGNIPPRGMIYTGTGDFIAAGNRFLSFFQRYAALQPHHRVLDVGSGIGRMALPLTNYLNEKGSYEGFDIVNSGVQWCRKNITSKYPNFQFRWINLKNDLYSAKGDYAAKFIFPYEDSGFDLVFLTSVFTHMLPDEVENYMKEISRVLRPGGKCLATFFVFGDNSGNEKNKPYFSFPIDHGHYRLLNPRVKSANVAYDHSWLRKKLAEENQLTICNFIPGFWRGIQAGDHNDFQDIVVFEKL